MAITELNLQSNASVRSVQGASRTKIISVVLLFLLSVASFVAQTEFTSQAYLLGFEEPIIMLTATHGSWWVLWPLQVLTVAIYRTIQKARNPLSSRKAPTDANALLLDFEQLVEQTNALARDMRNPTASFEMSRRPEEQPTSLYKYFKKSIVKQIHNVYHTSILIYEANVNQDTSTHNLDVLVSKNNRISNSSAIWKCVSQFISTPAFRYVFIKSAIVSFVVNIAGFMWHAAMSLTYASDVTAIYNCSAFTAYAFAIPILNEKFSWLKASSVVIAVSGVFIVAYSGADSEDLNDQYPYRLWGNIFITIGAILYGYYEVIYKKYVCIADHLSKVITARRQVTFANFAMGLISIITFITLVPLLFLLDITKVKTFNLFGYGEHTKEIWIYILCSMLCNLLFSVLFLSLMALTNPVLSSVSSLVTIFVTGIVEWILFDNALGPKQILGNSLVIVGFVVLTIASWNEISEGKDEDEMETASLYSFAASENTIQA
ncbi:hypothetical protein PUMCH_001836 [Australozyma saopauloensis]|uniref:EamA domain-containing protein n=1 Tax=Australozyma saopauloensis TaxID=291208 RepID=A0AAX4H7P6_9ASCO|nr:hypothetical protein PUMCH_001836 [[Candida] saopauloensis]